MNDFVCISKSVFPIRVPSVLEGSAQVWATVCNAEDFAIQISSNQYSETIDLHGNKVTGGNII